MYFFFQVYIFPHLGSDHLPFLEGFTSARLNSRNSCWNQGNNSAFNTFPYLHLGGVGGGELFVVVADIDIIQDYRSNFVFSAVGVFCDNKSQKQKKLMGWAWSPAIPAPAADSCNRETSSFHSILLRDKSWSKLVQQVQQFQFNHGANCWDTLICLWKVSRTTKQCIALLINATWLSFAWWMVDYAVIRSIFKAIKMLFCKHRCLNINQSSATILLKYLTIFWLSLTVILTVLMKWWCQPCLSVAWETAALVILFLKQWCTGNRFIPMWKCGESCVIARN